MVTLQPVHPGVEGVPTSTRRVQSKTLTHRWSFCTGFPLMLANRPLGLSNNRCRGYPQMTFAGSASRTARHLRTIVLRSRLR